MSHKPYCRETGAGPAVLCLHSSASSGGQWRQLADVLSGRFRVLAPDVYGYGRSAAQDSERDFGLMDELDWLEPIVENAGDSFSLVGHSYGGLIALLLALRYPKRVRSIVVYEPAAWSVAVAADAFHPGAQEIDALRQALFRLVDEGRLMAAAEAFVRYWAGDPAWESMSEDRRQTTAYGMKKVRSEFAGEIACHEAGVHTVERLASITAPIGYLLGSGTKASARRVAEVIVPRLPNVHHYVMEGMGHMGPVTHPNVFNDKVVEVLSAA